MNEFTPSTNHWSVRRGLFKERVTTKQLQYVLLNTPDPIIRGNIRQWKHKRIGPGIYELWVEDKA